MYDIHQISDEKLVKIAHRWMHWLIYCDGIDPISAYSLREALIEGRRMETTEHVVQRIRIASGEATIERSQIERLWTLCGQGSSP
jgi:hypothetical protein